MENQGTNEDDSQSDPHPEAGIFRSQITQNSGPEVARDLVTGVIEEAHVPRDMVTGVQGEIRYRPDMATGARDEIRNRRDMVTRVHGEIRYRPDKATGAREEIRNRHDMVTGVQKERLCGHDMVTRATESIRNGHDLVTAVQEEIPYQSSGISSAKQKKARSTSQPQFRSESTPATIEADQILLPLQQLATNNNSANFNNNSNRISKLPKSLTTTMPTFDGKSGKLELYEDLFQTSLNIHNQLTEEDKINYFHSLMRRDALQTFRNISSPDQENPAENLTVFRRK